MRPALDSRPGVAEEDAARSSDGIVAAPDGAATTASGRAAQRPPAGTMDRLLRAAAQYSVGTLLAMIASIARVGVTARVLSDAENGIWLGLQLVLSYAGNLHLGSLYGMFRSVPMLRARGEDDSAESEKRTAFGFVLVMTLVGVLGVLALAPRISRASSARHVVLTMAMLAANLLRMYWTTVLKAESRFRELSIAFAVGAAATGVSLLLVATYRLDGLLIGMLFQAVVEVAFMASRSRPPMPHIDRAVLKAQLRVGLMTLGTTVGVIALTSADRSMMLRIVGAKATGSYYLGANVITLMPTLMLIPVGVLTPSFFERVGRGEDLMPLVERPLRAMAPVQAWLCAAIALALPATVRLVWPHHAPGVPAAIAALFGTYPLVLAGLVTNVYYALDRQGVHVAILAACAALGFGLAALGLRLCDGAIVGAAGGGAVALAVYFLVSAFAALRIVPSLGLNAGRAAATLVVEVAAPIAWAGLLLYAVLLVLGERWWSGSVVHGLAAEVVVALAFVPFAPRVLRAFRGRHVPVGGAPSR